MADCGCELIGAEPLQEQTAVVPVLTWCELDGTGDP
jgi:hypothetical protein